MEEQFLLAKVRKSKNLNGEKKEQDLSTFFNPTLFLDRVCTQATNNLELSLKKLLFGARAY